MSKQATLFQTWGQKGKPSSSAETTSTPDANALDDDDDDEYLLLAIAESLKDVDPSNVHNTHSKVEVAALPSAGKSSTAVGAPSGGQYDEDSNEPILPDITNIPDLPGFDKEAGRMWIYPTNYPVREYQFNVIKSALLENTLVVLPTGLGKTFIAAVVMYNFYRWYPEGKVIFMAPTKPLVAQQIEACYNIMGIPQRDTAEMTGAMQPAERKKSWQRQRVFFLTPQVMVNDLSRGICPYNDVKCLVVDEAHKALGNHAYCQVVRELIKYTSQFRVLCLSATPGSDIKAVQQVISNMLVSHVELRTEDMPDLLPYVHERKVDKIVVPLGEELNEAKEVYLRIIGTVVQRLKRHGVIYNREAKSLSKFMILKAREAYRMDPPENLQGHQKGSIEGDFAMCMTLYHGYELLLQHGLRSLFSFLECVLSGQKGHPKTRTELQRNGDFNGLMEKLRSKFVATRAVLPHTQATQQSGQNVVASGHPKLNKLEEIVIQHFRDFANRDEGGHKTRVMIFAQYRDSVSEITEILNRHKPLVRVMSFIGQSSAGKSARGFTQKEQLKVMKDFREGGYNTLVSTCVGEEGLDIGDVDLIVCFDAHKSPIRLVQRMGRTGRKREGRIVMLMTEGKEEQVYNQSQCSKRSIHKAILNGTKSLHYYPQNPRMIPDGLTPACHKMHITIHTLFIPTDKSKAVPKQQKSTIAKLMDSFSEKRKGIVNAKAPAKCDGFLTPEELSYWSQHLKMQEKVPILPKTEIVSLRKKHQTDGLPDLEPFDPSSSTLRLNEWMPWQNRLQQTHIVSHSIQSKQFVDLMGFMDIQAAIGEEDNYGQEMALFLNEEDILPCGQSNRPGILRYCTPKGDEENGQKGKSKARKSVRRRSTLPGFDSDVELDSEEELPGLDEIMQQRAVKDSATHGIDNNQDDSGPDLQILGSQGLARARKKSSIGQKIISKTPTRRIIKTPSGKKIWLNQGLSQSQRRKLQTKKMIRLSQSWAERSLIKPIEVQNDVDDFEFSECPAPEIDPVLDAVREVEQLETEIPCETEGQLEDLPDNFDAGIGQQTRDVVENMEVDADDELDDVFPDFFKSKSSQTRDRLDGEYVGGECCVPAPPSLEKLDDLTADLEEKGKLSPVNILELVDKWGPVLKVRNGGNGMHSFNRSVKTEEKAGKSTENVPGFDESDLLIPAGVPIDFQDFSESMEVEEDSIQKAEVSPNDIDSNIEWQKKSDIIPLTTPRKHFDVQMSMSPLMSVSKMKPPRESSTPMVNLSGAKRSSQRKTLELNKSKERLSVKFEGLGHESFFVEEDDEMFAAIVTPKAAQPPTVHDSKLNQSVFTFSQALLAVDSVNFESSSSEKTSSSVSPASCQVIEMESPLITTPKKQVTPAKSATLPQSKVVESPIFDLGFDLDELDDDMVIPPSPPAAGSQSLSQKSLVGIKATKSLSQRSFLTAKPSVSGSGNTSKTASLATAARLEKRSGSLQLVLEDAPVIDEHFDDIDFEESFHFFANQTKDEIRKSFTKIKDKQNKVPVATVEPLVNENNLVTQNEKTVDIQGNDQLADLRMDVIEIPETEFFDDMVEEETPQSKEENVGDVTSESHDESPIAAPKRRRNAAILLSQESPNPQKTNDDSSFKSPLAVPKKRTCGRAVLFSESSEEEEMKSAVQGDISDSDFDDAPSLPRVKNVKCLKSNKEKDKKKKKSGGRAFLDEEAELSEEDWSSDEMDGSQMDKFEASFVNDATQCSQQVNVDMHAVYMKSIRSPEMRGKFKLIYQGRPRMDIYSQQPQDEMSEYAPDSFCVDDEYDSFIADEEEYEEPESLGEISIVEEISKNKSTKPKKGSGKRKRIVVQSSSSSDEEEGDHEMTALKEQIGSREETQEANKCRAVGSKKVLSESDGSANDSNESARKLGNKAKSTATFNTERSISKSTHLNKGKTADTVAVTGSSKSVFTQNIGSSLASRCQQRLKSTTTEDTTIASTSRLQSASVAHAPSNLNPPEVPMFSLGFDDLLGDDDFDNVCDIKCDTNKTPSPKSTRTSSIKVGHTSKANLDGKSASAASMSASSASKQSAKNLAGSTGLPHKSPDELRAEKRRLARLKQEEFRQKFKQKTPPSSLNSPANAHTDAASSCFAMPNLSFTNKPSSNKIAVLVDSKEIGSAQDIVSELRSKHGLMVEVRQLGTCDYILSNRMAVERKSITDFTNGANRSKLLERIQLMCREFERPCIVVEKDRIKPGEEKKRFPILKTKYVENMLACLANTNIKLFFTDTQEETSNLLAELAQQEERKSFAINVKLQLSPSQNQVLCFYQTLPRVSYITALNLMHNFRTINEFAHSVPGIIARRGVMPENRATELWQYLKRKFDLQLISSKK